MCPLFCLVDINKRSFLSLLCFDLFSWTLAVISVFDCFSIIKIKKVLVFLYCISTQRFCVIIIMSECYLFRSSCHNIYCSSFFLLPAVKLLSILCLSHGQTRFVPNISVVIFGRKRVGLEYAGQRWVGVPLKLIFCRSLQFGIATDRRGHVDAGKENNSLGVKIVISEFCLPPVMRCQWLSKWQFKS